MYVVYLTVINIRIGGRYMEEFMFLKNRCLNTKIKIIQKMF